MLLISSSWTAVENFLFVFIELLQVLYGHELELNELGSVDIGGIGENADAHSRSRDVGELDGT